MGQRESGIPGAYLTLWQVLKSITSGCTWTLCSTQSGDGWPQRSQLQPGVPSLGRCVTLLPATFCNLGLGDPLSSCNKRIVFINYSFLLGKPTAATIRNSASTIAHRLMIAR